MKDAYGDGNAIAAVVWGFLLFYGFVFWVWAIYRLTYWIAS